ncbi:Csa-G protein beta 2-like protein [Dinothrombium tinctorium]|uniref:Csa-G protein beta 2-like protein n=1 Tax=Dinothrombium tinctorium TaxID=1965070 RepID=A0A3S3QAM6_9ACAR|nr:Csa-G protein beta 2-like protein [Dinothrombium tinctorium]RWS16879.1 Csa-G protein beta 2-like protein [Dinothrombium tinctorium]
MQGSTVINVMPQHQQHVNNSVSMPPNQFRGQYNSTHNQYQKYQKNSSFYVFQPRPPVPPIYQATEFDGKRLRKAIARKTVDYNSSVVKTLENRVWQKYPTDRKAIQPDVGYYTELVPPFSMLDNPVNCITTKFVRTSTNKMRCPIFCVLWTPEGRRLVTGASSGEFTLWNGLTFNFETILQAHDSAVRVMVWSRSDSWMVTADHGGYVKYWQSNMNNVKMFQAHKEPVRAIRWESTGDVSPYDGTVRIWDFLRCFEERILRGHGADVKGVDWHPSKALVVSGSKDSQQPIKLWDPKTGQSLATIHAHKNTVMDVKWNQNGNWLLTASRDHLIKIFDIRNMSQEMQTFRGHKKEACCLSWHPIHESLFASGGSDGSILFWLVGTEKEVGGMEQAHDSVVWSLSWHPLGHILASGSNDHTCKFWTRNRPGDKMRDKYNLNLMPKGQEEVEYEDIVTAPSIPGMGFNENDVEFYEESGNSGPNIPGLGLSEETSAKQANEEVQQRKVPYSKPVPKQFQNQWSDKKGPSIVPTGNNIENNAVSSHQDINNINSSVPGIPHSTGLLGPPPPFEHHRYMNAWSSNSSESSQRLTDYHHSGHLDNYSMTPPHPDNNYRHRSQSPIPPPMLNRPPPDNIRHHDIDERYMPPRDEDYRRWNYDMRPPNDWRRQGPPPPEAQPPWTRRPPPPADDRWRREPGDGRREDHQWEVRIYH